MTGYLKMNAGVRILYDYIIARSITITIAVHAKAVFIGRTVGSLQGGQAVGQDRSSVFTLSLEGIVPFFIAQDHILE